MYKVSVMHPNQEGARFDFEYYRTTHMKLVAEHLKAFGLVKTGVDKGLSGGGEDPERLDLFAVRGPPASPKLLRAPFAFRDFGVPYRRSVGRKAERR